jgi:hypothetical protein
MEMAKTHLESDSLSQKWLTIFRADGSPGGSELAEGFRLETCRVYSAIHMPQNTRSYYILRSQFEDKPLPSPIAIFLRLL